MRLAPHSCILSLFLVATCLGNTPLSCGISNCKVLVADYGKKYKISENGVTDPLVTALNRFENPDSVLKLRTTTWEAKEVLEEAQRLFRRLKKLEEHLPEKDRAQEIFGGLQLLNKLLEGRLTSTEWLDQMDRYTRRIQAFDRHWNPYP